MQTIKLTGYYQSRYYPQELRLVGFIDPETKKEFVFLTNNFTLSAYTITQIYKARWQIELFFKWIKQNWNFKECSINTDMGRYVLLPVALLHKIPDKILLFPTGIVTNIFRNGS